MKTKEKKKNQVRTCAVVVQRSGCDVGHMDPSSLARMAQDERPRNWICGFGPSFHQSLGPHRHIYRVLETEWSDSIIRKLL